jgi:hypothetical protein
LPQLRTIAVTEIQRIDAAIAAEVAAREIYVAKVAALNEEIRKERYHQREADRRKAITAITKKLTQRERVGAEREAAIELVGRKYAELISLPSLIDDWPFASVSWDLTRMDMKPVNREISWAMYSASRPHNGMPSMPQGNSIGLGVSGVSAEGIAEVIRKPSVAIISSLELAPSHNDLMNEVA